MADATVHCPHCKAPVTLPVGQVGCCPSCGGEVRIHAVEARVEDDEALKRLLSSVKIVERVGGSAGSAEPQAPPPKKRPWWKFWG
jgi:uncharacterized Zn finger protein (UPF0148 family)